MRDKISLSRFVERKKNSLSHININYTILKVNYDHKMEEIKEV